MTTLSQSILDPEKTETKSPATVLVGIIHWIKAPVTVDDTEARLHAQDEWFKTNQATILQAAEANTKRLTGKPCL